MSEIKPWEESDKRIKTAEEFFEEQLELNIVHVHNEEELQRMFKFADTYAKNCIENIPIQIHQGVTNIRVDIKNGIIIIKPNKL